MRKLIPSIIRIMVGVVTGLALIVLLIGLMARQPNIGRNPFPEGPRADPATLRTHVEYLSTQAFPRNPTAPASLNLAADYIKAALLRTGAVVTEQPYEAFHKPFRNIIATYGPAIGRKVVVGAHYDVYGEFPGADDNASGVAGLLELGRLLGARKPQSPIELVAFSTEEPPYFGGPEMGSATHAKSLRKAGAPVEAMISLEMIGYFIPKQPCTNFLLYLIYPRRGDFISIAGRWRDRSLARKVKMSFRGATTVPAVSYSGPVEIGADLSDQRNYWAAGYPAVMVTDTAFMRNFNYHTPGDVPATLDYDRMAGVVDGVLSAVIHLTSGSAGGKDLTRD